MRNYIIILSLLFVLISCLSPLERKVRKRELAKVKLESILSKYPELLSTSDTSYIRQIDTVINTRSILFRDTISIPKEVIDSSFYLDYDSLYEIHKGNLNLIVKLNKANELLITASKDAQTIYYTDTFTIRDTVIVKEIVKEYTKIIDTQPSLIWSIWTHVKSWLWLIILVLIAIITFKTLKNATR